MAATTDPFEDFSEAEGLDSNRDPLPYSTKTERCLIGIVVNHPTCLHVCMQKGISRDHFHEMQSQLWSEILLAESSGRPFDEMSLADRLAAAGNGAGEELYKRLQECTLGPGNSDKIDGYCETLIDTKIRRDAITIGKNLIKFARDGTPHWRDELQKIQEIGNSILQDELPPMISAADLCENPPPTPPEVIEGVLHQGSKFVLGGGSKSFKTWVLLEIAISIATGEPWLGFDTARSRVLYVNFELPSFSMEKRIKAICAAMNVSIPTNLMVWNLRGHANDAGVILPKITNAIQNKGYSAVFLDPIYKVLGDREENSPRDMTNLMNSIEQVAERTHAAVLFGSHFAKGNASGKESFDRISGSGVIARDPDSIVTMTKHQKEECFSVELTLRNFPPQEPFVISRKHPLMVIESTLDPGDLKKPKPKGGGAAKYSADDALEELKSPMKTAEWQKVCDRKMKMSSATFYRKLTELRKTERIVWSETDETWSRKE